MRKLLFLTTFLALVISCGKTEEETPVVQGFSQLNTDDAKELTDEQKTTASRMCVALTAKRISVQRDYEGDRRFFIFKRFKKECGSQEVALEDASATLTSPLPGEPGQFKPLGNLSDGFFSSIITEDHPLVKDFCDDVVANRSVLDLIVVDGNYQKYIIAGDSTLEIITYQRESDGEYYARRIDQFTISLNRDNNQGFLTSRASGTYCAQESTETKYYRQTTNFTN